MIAVFARPDHPEGYGFGKTAHGYAVAAVRCTSVEQVERVRRRLANEGLPEPFGHDSWYGGRMDLVVVVQGAGMALFSGEAVTLHAGLTAPAQNGENNGRRVSVGDNRYVGLYEAAEILA